MADRDLPVWTIPPNWSEAVLERLEWLTDVLASRSGCEQRASVRLTPRRSFDMKFNPTGRVRSYLELWLHRLGASEFLLPLFHDRGRMSASTAEGATRIPLDTTYREFEEGGLAVILGDAFTWELIEIVSLDDTGLNIAGPSFLAWEKGSSVYPLRVVTLDSEVTSQAITSRVGEGKFTFTTNRSNPLTVSADPLPVYDGLPLISLPPNRMDSLEAQYARVMEELDQGIGRRRLYDENGRAFAKQFYNWQAKGRQEHAALRQTLYRLAGRRVAAWMPSFNEDITLAASVTPTSDHLRVEKIGYKYLGGGAAIAGKRDILLKDDTGAIRVVRVNSVGVDPAPGQERLNLSAVTGFSAASGRTGSFVSTVRLDQDTVEITHHTDSDGICECSAAFVAFNNARAVTGPLILPTPTREMSFTACGTPEPDRDGTCLSIATFEGWVWRVKAVHRPYMGMVMDDTGAWVVSTAGVTGAGYTGPALAAGQLAWQWNNADPSWNPPAGGGYFYVQEQHGAFWTDPWPPGTHIIELYYQHWTWTDGYREAILDHGYGDWPGYNAAGMILGPGTYLYAGSFPRNWRWLA